MSKQFDRQCIELNCINRVNNWRSCPNTLCKHEEVYCEDHGGEERAVTEMKKHIAESYQR